ncbi:YCF48-related protein [Salmonirosea aquatica]|uniref:Photosynthesis system II assembly factor Ycf48/Hcf136-like domain-containing protein n=1 Tax=Salmonirosea aquatica TaxID=2654236 RepID=A0A7C9FEU5_9BACT|nr:hypothetical protein [Cytophagaceae bacterium SJW1-29]
MKSFSTIRLSFHALRSTRAINCLFLGVLLVSCFSAAAQPGLVAHYAFNGTFTDQTTNGNHALPTGNPAFISDRKGIANRALALGGCGNLQFLRVPNSASLQVTNALTVAFWAQVDLNSGMDPGTGACNANGGQVFFAKAGDGYGVSPPGLQGLTYLAEGQQRITFEANAGQVATGFSRELPGYTWHHYVYVLSTSEVKLYIDAQLVHTSPAALSFEAANQQDLYLGAMGPKSSPVLGTTHWYPLKGALDDVRIFNRELNSAEISTVYASDDSGSCTPALSVLPTADQTICAGQSITLKGVPSAEVQLQWLKDGQPIAQAILDSLVVSQAGAYRLTATRRTDNWKHDMQGFDNTLNDVQYIGTTGWIVGEYGTLLKTTDGGTSWDTLPTFRDTHFYTVNFIDTQAGWIGGAGGLLIKSTDGGSNWQPQYFPTTGDVNKIQFLDQNVGYARGGELLYKTTNGGNSWQAVPLPESFPVNFSFVDADFGWIIIGKNIYKTENGGDSWNLQKSYSQYFFLGNLYALDRNRVWVTYFQDQNYSSVTRTTDGGLTWSFTDFPIPAQYPSLSDFGASDLLFINAQIGYAIGRMYTRVYARYGVNSGAIFKTEDGGQTWSLIFDNQYFIYPRAISLTSPTEGTVVGAGGFLGKLSGSPTTVSLPSERTFLPLTSVGGTSDSVFAVGGFPRIIEEGTHPDSKAVLLSKVTGQSWVKNETGFGRSPIGGYPFNNGYTIRQIKFKNDQLGWKVGLGALYSTTDGGTTWKYLFPTDLPPPTSLIIEKAYFKTDTTGFFIARYPAYDGAGLFRFSGKTRTGIPINFKDPSDPSTTGMLDLQFINDQVGFITTSNGKLIKTTDGGTSWSVHVVQANTALNRCYFVTAQTGWVVGENGLILKTINGGQSWTTQNSGLAVSWNGIYFLSAQEGYLVGSQGTLIKTSDGGNSWVRIETNTHNTLNDITFTTRDKGYIVGDYGTILSFNPTLLPDCKATSEAVYVNVSSGTLCQTTTTGTWNNVATWSCGHVPLACDQVAINPGHVVTLTESVQVHGIEIRQDGQLLMQGGNVLIQE